jgi:hypothetical protein
VAEPLDELFTAAFVPFSAAAKVDSSGRSQPDSETGEQWDLAQVLGHTSEMLEYWLVEVLRVLAHGLNELSGRLKRSPERLTRIDGNSLLPIAELRHEIEMRAATSIDLCRILTPTQLQQRGNHLEFGSMTVESILTEFGVEHLREHASQLKSTRLAGSCGNTHATMGESR